MAATLVSRCEAEAAQLGRATVDQPRDSLSANACGFGTVGGETRAAKGAARCVGGVRLLAADACVVGQPQTANDAACWRTAISLYSVRMKSPMRAPRISEDIVPVSDFKAHAAELLRRLAETGQPLVITQNGKAAGVLLSPERFDELTERARFVEAVNAGLADSEADRVYPHEEVVERMQKRAKQRRG
jgi:prevent-host-death family protein